ncbi:leucyl/phenylalanyl-tRNA--protein transferase [Sphingobacterium hungaricum]|uniref:Leucyl/phenylalanyl-tRNA--protein transferase n=1 Tax=Sphingobacterium hungaricum TaxID=2082723 RepID=A0A928UUB6_9SPHI|nr:leucyl/phenylalanyl-tRNA--protein transferase [Sphingobacterium hungaricum]MBE8713491.1 leucyl/phenylalanyl-tRNA--protein transferase [Sphingobacterium hungaricum]
MISLLDPQKLVFPNQNHADEDGLLAVGGDLQAERLLLAYQNGIFPWYNPGDPILWFSPDPRCVIFPADLKISKSMKKVFAQQHFSFTYNKNFSEVIRECALATRKDQDGTWITDEMQEAYINLHALGYAQSVEVWDSENKLVGGLYGILVDRIFVGESMFSTVSNASKAGLIYLITNFELELIDCQVHNDHLESLGATLIPRDAYLSQIQKQNIHPYGLQKLLRHS